MNSVELFNQRGQLYNNGREGYSQSLFDFLYKEYIITQKSIVADVGSGTGIFAEQILARGSNVICIEPNRYMLAVCIEKLGSHPNCLIKEGTAEHTGLKDKLVDCITVSQAFHWFEAKVFREECNRIKKEDGRVVLVWNMRDMNCPVLDRINKLQNDFDLKLNMMSSRIKEDDDRIKRFFCGNYLKRTFDYPLVYAKDKFIYRHMSSSYAPKPGSDLFEPYRKEIMRIYDECNEDGAVTIPNRTVVYVGR